MPIKESKDGELEINGSFETTSASTAGIRVRTFSSKTRQNL